MKNELLDKLSKGTKNLIVEGGLSSGKTTNVLFPIVDRIIDRKESLVVLDSKEEYLNMYYKKLKDSDYNTVIINLREPNLSEGWNPLAYAYDLFKSGDKDNAQEQIEKIGKTIFYNKNSLDPFWTDSAKDLFTGFCLGLFEDAEADEINLNSINNMFNSVGKNFSYTTYDKEYFNLKGEDSKPYIFASSTVLAPTETKGGILSTGRQKLRLYISREKISQVLSKTTFDIKDIVKKPTAIILIGRDEVSSFVNDIISMFISQLYSILVSLKSDSRVNIILDNFDSIDNFDSLTDILGSCISRNVKTFIATRSLNDLALKYSNSVNYLCDLVKINNENISMIINNIEDSINKEFERVIISRDESIEYPKNTVESIKVFNIERFVESKKLVSTGNIDNPFLNDDFKNRPSVDIDGLIKKIDDKIAEIDDNEKKEEKSTFESFKINE